jgi:hypothetical protein
MNELLFSAMDVPNEVEKVLKKIEAGVCKGMTDSERKAYDFGVSTVLNITRSLLEMDGDIAVHISGFDHMEEMDIAELEEIFLK